MTLTLLSHSVLNEARVEKVNKSYKPVCLLMDGPRRHQWTYATGRVTKDDGKSCVTSVKIILLEKSFRQTSHSFKQIFLKNSFKQQCELNWKSEFPTKHAIGPSRLSHSSVLPSCCVNSLLCERRFTVNSLWDGHFWDRHKVPPYTRLSLNGHLRL